MKTLRCFRLIAGSTLYEHHEDQRDGVRVPAHDDVIYTKQGRQFLPTTRHLQCAGCQRPRLQCHCAPVPQMTTLESVVARQRELGVRP